MEEESNAMDGQISEAEDLLLSDVEDASPVNDILLIIDYNARVISKEENFDADDGDNCDMYSVDKNDLLCRRGSENRLLTSTEDLNISDEEEQCNTSLTQQSIDLDGLASISAKKNTSSLSTLDYSHTVFKDGYSTDAEYMSDDEVKSNREEKFINEDKFKRLSPGLAFAGFASVPSTGSSVILPSTQKTLNTLNIKNVFSKSLLIDENDMIDLYDDHESPLMTCLEFLKSEISDDNNTDAEDISVGSLNDICESSRKNRNPREGGCNEFNIPISIFGLPFEKAHRNREKGITYTGDSRRSSTAEFLTEDETFNLENFCNPGKKRLKKRNFRLVDKSDRNEVSDDSLTDEEFLQVGNKEWTETDDSGGVRQITQIKTETSIKLEGEGAVRSLKKVPKKEPSGDRKSSTDSEQEDLSFSEKKSMFQRLSLTSDTLPKGNKWTQEVSLDDLPMAHGEIVQEQISFEDKFKMFEPDEVNRKRIQKRDKPDQPTVYRYDFTKSAKEKPIASEFVVSELEKAEEIVKQVNEELNMEEDSLNDPHFDLSERTHSRSDQDSAFTLERVEQEVSSLLAEVDKEEKELSNDLRRVSCSRTDSDKSSNINSRIFDMESERGNGSSDYAALSPDIIQESLTTTESHLTYSEVDVVMQDGEKVTVFESKSVVDKKSFDEEQCMEMASELEAEDNVTTMQAEPIVESPSCTQFEQTPENVYDISTDEVAVYTITEDNADRKLSVDMLKKDEFKEALKLDEDDSEHDSLIHPDRPSKLLDISSTVDSHIKSEILREEIDQSIEESPLEVKQIAEDLENIASSEDHKCNVYKHIRTEIFTQVLGEDIESGSPERKEISVLSPKSDPTLDEVSEEQDLIDKIELEQKMPEKAEDKSGTYEAKSCIQDSLESKLHKDLSPQVSEESICQTDEMSSEGLVVEQDEHLVDYEEALDEHSLTEQLQALASDSKYSVFGTSDLQQAEFGSYNTDFKASAMSSSMSDLEIHRRAKDLYSRHDKKEIRSLKSTKQVSTIEEHSSIESCDSPQELMRQDFSEKYTSESYNKEEKSDVQEKIEMHDTPQPLIPQDFTKKCSENESYGKEKSDLQDMPPEIHTFSVLSDSAKSELGDLKSSEEVIDLSFDDKSLQEIEASDKMEESFKQPEGSNKTDKLSRSDSKSSQGKKSDSDAEGSKGESTLEMSGKRKEESCSSSGETESPYYSVETSDSGRTPRSTPAASRPCSSEFDINVFSGQGSEYETCVTSQEASGEASGSYVTAISSQEISYATACSSFSHSSRESAYSVDSESSGHLASVEVSSEASETLVPSAQEMELEFGPELEMPVLDEEPSSSEEGVKEPYDMDIPESVIRGGIEMPFMKTWGLKNPVIDDKDAHLQQWSWQYAAESEVLDKFEILESNNDITDEQKYDSLPTANIETVEECSSHITTVTDTAKCFTQVETVSSVHEGPGHRRSYSSVFDIIPDRENVEHMAAPIEEEQQSVSESSATHSEQTWQTNSVDTAVQLSSQAPVSCVINESSSLFSASDSFQETPPEKELTSEQSSSGLQPESYLQLNGPVEVEYNPDYDNPDVDNSELNHDQQVSHYEVDGLQFDLEIDGTFNNIINGASTSNTAEPAVNNYSNNAGINNSNESAMAENYVIHPSSEYESHTTGASSDAEKPEAQQEQSLSFNNYGAREAESLVCPDLTSYLPESDQCDLMSVGDSLPPSYESEINIPCSESLNSNELLVVESRSQLLPDLQSTDSIEKTDVVDTSPEDERYEYKSVRPSSSDKYNEEKDLENMSSLLKCDEGDILAESDYVPPSYTSKYDEPPCTELYTHHEEEEFDLRESDVYPSPIPSIEEDKQSTPSSDVLHGRRFFPRSGDTSAASSLQEFERLEAEIAAGRLSRSSIDSSEKMAVTKSGEHDDVSMSSLTEFEKLEREFVDEGGDKIVEDIMLSEIDEGLESQCSDALEILTESLHDGSDTSEYERRRLDFEEIIKVAQSNVEKFQEETLSDAVTSDECTVLMRALSEAQDTSEGTKVSSKEEGITDAEESELLPITLEADNAGGHDSSSSGEKNYGKGDCMVSSTDSIDPSSSTATHATYQFETDSVMSSSINSAQASGEECTMVSSTDTLEPEPKLTYSQGDLSSNERIQSSSTEPLYKKGSLACKLDELKELESTNGAKEQMEMFLSKLTDESVLMEDFPPHSFSDTVDDSEQHTTSDDLLKSCEAAQGFSMSGDDLGIEGDDIISRTTTTTTRIVTTVTTDGEQESHEDQQILEDGDDLRHSVEVILNQFMSSDSEATRPEDSTTEHDE